MKADLKGGKGIDTSRLVSKTTLTSLKTKLDNLDVDVAKLKTFSADFCRLSNLVDNGTVKKAEYDKLATRVNAIVTKIPSTSGLVTKTQYDSDKQGLKKKIEDVDKKIPNSSELVGQENDYCTKITETEKQDT